MQTPRRVWVTILLLGLAGAALCITLFIRHGITDIAKAVAAAGWGVAAVVVFHAVPLLCDVLSWRALIPIEDRLPLAKLYFVRWIGDSVSSMLPVAQVGGEIVRVRLSVKSGMAMSVAVASVLVGMTIGVLTQIPFTLGGLALLFILTRRSGLAMPVLAGSALGVLCVAGFYAVQRAGMFRFGAVIISNITKSGAWHGLIERAETFDQDVRALYSRRRSLIASGIWVSLGWAAGAIEVWIALRALGAGGTYAQSFVLESVSQGIRSVAFLVPGALGVQEGGYLAVGSMLGFSPETALALALIRRVRELAFGLPGVIAWQLEEWRHFRRGAGKQNAASRVAQSSCASAISAD